MKKKVTTLIICGALAGIALVGLTFKKNIDSIDNSKDIDKASIESVYKNDDLAEGNTTEIDSYNKGDGADIIKNGDISINEDVPILSRGSGQPKGSQSDEKVITSNEGSNSKEDEESNNTVDNQQEITYSNPSTNIEKPSVPSQETSNVPAQSPPPTTTVNGNFSAQIEQLIFTKVNEERSRAGMSTISYSSLMEKYARMKSQDMGDKNYFEHKNLEGEFITAQMDRDGISYRSWGENIAYIGGVTDINELANQFMTNWMNSQGHRENILSPNFTSIGVGVYKAGNRYYATQEFYK
jgi:uncharacterized protein YkwD